MIRQSTKINGQKAAHSINTTPITVSPIKKNNANVSPRKQETSQSMLKMAKKKSNLLTYI